MHMRFLRPGGAFAFEHPGGDHVLGPEVLLADGAHPAQGGGGAAVGAARDLHDLVGGRRREDHRMDPFTGTKRAAAQRARLTRRGRLGRRDLGTTLRTTQRKERENHDDGQGEGAQEDCHVPFGDGR